MRGRNAVAVSVAVVLAASPLLAQSTADAWERCHSYTDPESANPDRAIAGCTGVIESRQFTRAQQLAAMATRGNI